MANSCACLTTMSNRTNTFAHAIGRRIASARRAALLAQEQFAQRLGWPRDTLIHYEHGRRALAIDRLAAIATALGVHPVRTLSSMTQHSLRSLINWPGNLNCVPR